MRGLFLPLTFLFITVPLTELALLIEFGRRFGTGSAILLVIGTALLGAHLWRSQGTAVLRRIQTDLQAGRMPGESLLDGALVLAAGLLVLTPGLLTDAIGFAFLLPPTRRLIRPIILRWLRRRFMLL